MPPFETYTTRRFHALLIRLARSFSSESVTRRNWEGWPYPIPPGHLDFDGLVGRAETYAERRDVPFHRTYRCECALVSSTSWSR